MQVFEESAATIARTAVVSVLKSQFQAYTLVGGTVALVTMTAPLKLALQAMA
jgi:hypothetical protein